MAEEIDPLANALADFFDLDKWTEERAKTDTSRPFCPECGSSLSILELQANGTGKCLVCHRPFVWTVGPTPVGYAWHTRYRVAKKGGAS